MSIRPPFFSRKHDSKPEFYRMTCTKCDFEKKYELAKDYMVVSGPASCSSDFSETVEELPKVCPKCGAKLKKQKLPVTIHYEMR